MGGVGRTFMITLDLGGSPMGNISGTIQAQLGHLRVLKFANWMDLLSSGFNPIAMAIIESTPKHTLDNAGSERWPGRRLGQGPGARRP